MLPRQKLKSTHFLKSLSPHCAILVETLPIWFQPVSSSVLLPPSTVDVWHTVLDFAGPDPRWFPLLSPACPRQEVLLLLSYYVINLICKNCPPFDAAIICEHWMNSLHNHLRSFKELPPSPINSAQSNVNSAVSDLNLAE